MYIKGIPILLVMDYPHKVKKTKNKKHGISWIRTCDIDFRNPSPIALSKRSDSSLDALFKTDIGIARITTMVS